jgi:hypothetical protein
MMMDNRRGCTDTIDRLEDRDASRETGFVVAAVVRLAVLTCDSKPWPMLSFRLGASHEI